MNESKVFCMHLSLCALAADDAQDGQCHSTAQTAKMSLLDPNYTAGSGGSSSSSNFQRGTRQSRVHNTPHTHTHTHTPSLAACNLW